MPRPDDADVTRRVSRGHCRENSMSKNSDKDAGEKRGILSTERKKELSKDDDEDSGEEGE